MGLRYPTGQSEYTVTNAVLGSDIGIDLGRSVVTVIVACVAAVLLSGGPAGPRGDLAA